MTEELTQLNTRISEKLKRAVKVAITRLKETQDEFVREALTVWVFLTSDLEDLEQTREFVAIRPHILKIIRDADNPRKKLLLEALDMKEDVK